MTTHSKYKPHKKKQRTVTLTGDTEIVANCPKCGEKMQCRTHRQITQKQLNQPYYYLYWHYCSKCKHLQHYEANKVYNKN